VGVIAAVVDVVVAERLFNVDSNSVWVAAATWVGIQLFNVDSVAVVDCCDVSTNKFYNYINQILFYIQKYFVSEYFLNYMIFVTLIFKLFQ